MKIPKEPKKVPKLKESNLKFKGIKKVFQSKRIIKKKP